jgi:hypothetical protein
MNPPFFCVSGPMAILWHFGRRHGGNEKMRPDVIAEPVNLAKVVLFEFVWFTHSKFQRRE